MKRSRTCEAHNVGRTAQNDVSLSKKRECWVLYVCEGCSTLLHSVLCALRAHQPRPKCPGRKREKETGTPNAGLVKIEGRRLYLAP